MVKTTSKEVKPMKLFQKLENLLSASAFAEEGDFDTARQMVAENVESEPRHAASEDVRRGTTPPIAPGQLAPKA